MKIKEQTRKLATSFSEHSFEIAGKDDLVWRDFKSVLKASKPAFNLFY